MKKLLLLGGSRYLLPVIEAAHELGIYTITCDYLPDNTAHKYSDEYHNVSIIEKEAVLKIAQQLNVDGVMSFACDPGVVTAAYVAEKMGLPFQCSYKAASLLQDKGMFRNFLHDNGFNCPHAKRYENPDEPLNDTDFFNWPVIVKPVDSAGSKGVTRVDSPEQLPQAITTALDQARDGVPAGEVEAEFHYLLPGVHIRHGDFRAVQRFVLIACCGEFVVSVGKLRGAAGQEQRRCGSQRCKYLFHRSSIIPQGE